MNSRGTERRLTTHDTPQHNGVAESLNRRLLERVRAVLHSSQLPKFLWGEAIKFIVWLKNRVITRALGKVTPHEQLYGSKPDLSGVPEWGRPVWVHLDRESERFKALSLFNTIYGIGPATARTSYDRGLRSLRDLEAYYEVDIGSTPGENSESTDLNIRIALELHGELMRTCESLARNLAKSFVLTHIQHTAQRSWSHTCHDHGSPQRRGARLCQYHHWRVCVYPPT